MSASNEMNQQPAQNYRQIKLVGKKTNKIRYLVVLDQDQSGLNQHKRFTSASFRPGPNISKQRHQKIEQKVTQRVQKLQSRKTMPSKQWYSRCEQVLKTQPIQPQIPPQTQSSNQQSKQQQLLKIPKPARKTVKPPPHHLIINRPKTRSSVCQSQKLYTEQNQARIPEILDPKSTQYKKFLISKCLSLANREYINLN